LRETILDEVGFDLGDLFEFPGDEGELVDEVVLGWGLRAVFFFEFVVEGIGGV